MTVLINLPTHKSLIAGERWSLCGVEKLRCVYLYTLHAYVYRYRLHKSSHFNPIGMIGPFTQRQHPQAQAHERNHAACIRLRLKFLFEKRCNIKLIIIIQTMSFLAHGQWASIPPCKSHGKPSCAILWKNIAKCQN